jgi:excisionase family DNA binding protein
LDKDDAIPDSTERKLDHPHPASSPEALRRPTLERIWLTVDETVRYLGLPSRRALYQAVRRGQLPVHRMGRRLRFRRVELDEALSDR